MNPGFNQFSAERIGASKYTLSCSTIGKLNCALLWAELPEMITAQGRDSREKAQEAKKNTGELNAKLLCRVWCPE